MFVPKFITRTLPGLALASLALAACSENPTAPAAPKAEDTSPNFLAVGATGQLRDARYVSWTWGSTAMTLTARVNMDVTNGGTTGGFSYYTQAITNVAVPKVCNTTTIILRASQGRSTYRPVLNWEAPGHPVMFDYIGANVVSTGVNDFYYRASKCTLGNRNAGIVSNSTDRLGWSGQWKVSYITVNTTADVYDSYGRHIARVAAQDRV